MNHRRYRLLLGLVALASGLGSWPALANPKIRDSFFSVYPNVNGSHLTTLPSNPKPCGICHFDFNGGGNRNPYGLSIQNQGGLSSETGRTNAIWTVRTQDQDGDGYTAHTELATRTRPPTPAGRPPTTTRPRTSTSPRSRPT